MIYVYFIRFSYMNS